MKILQEKKTSDPSDCHYLPGEKWRFNYFFATDLDKFEINHFLSKGWRKFGYYYFKPECGKCKKCTPIRVCVKDFSPTKSQKRILNRNKAIRVEFGPLNYSDKIFEIYRDHSLNRFGKAENNRREFIASFFTESCPSCQSMYYLDERLIGVGFIDISQNALSSVYFIFDTGFSNYSPGIFSILKEIEYAENLGLDYYYLGYYIKECRSMKYKGLFFPHELYDWNEERWLPGKY